MKSPIKLDITKLSQIEDLREKIISSLLEFMDYCKLDGSTRSKYAIMGPAGKLLNLCKISGDIDWGQIKGYILNVVRMSGSYSVPIEAVDLIDQVVNDLKTVHGEIKGMEWLNFIEGIDYELFFQIFKTNKEGQMKYIREKFIEYLKKKYIEMNKIGEILGIQELKNEEDIPHPSDISEKGVIEAFWKDYKENKRKKGEK